MAQPLSLRAYARHRECRLNAVQEAIAAGRLKRSLVRAGKSWKIRAAELADAEWEASTLTNRIPVTGPASTGVPLEDLPDLAESRQRKEAAEARLSEIELAEKEGKLVEAKDVEARLVGVFTSCKTKLLGVPARARQRDPGLTAAQLALLEELIREALDGLASGEPEPKTTRRRARKAATEARA